ncbi:hypothetical protein AVL62_13505 [Serinicoccus chungangensis]|uniref:LysM domain-containing protein n=1 Tax=Serinicoccus chungangensis TaxID=767452 RepID=A0A0W8IBW9_9MICO|nr:hypothetical protein [Serinicoccus chungangensis]KUG57435.1 hypothetical protein AVL62_13505 [Serinicoccus chungangensis]
MGRYDHVPQAELEVTQADGTRRRVRYYRRRQLPDPRDLTTLATHTVAPRDRLDLVSHAYTADALGGWRLADANAALDPDDLVGDEAVGTDLRIPTPGVGGV